MVFKPFPTFKNPGRVTILIVEPLKLAPGVRLRGLTPEGSVRVEDVRPLGSALRITYLKTCTYSPRA